jgi:hypothetical protein
MGSAHSRPSKSRPETSSKAKAARERIRTAREALEALEKQDSESGGYSVKHCSAMARYWGARFLEADAKLAEAETPDDVKAAHTMLKLASMEAGEWEKRKAGAMASTKVDTLKEVLAILAKQEALAAELDDVPE